MVKFEMDYTDISHITSLVSAYESDGLKLINDIIHTEAGEVIRNNINMLLPESGRTWKGKKPPAVKVAPFKEDTSEMMAITIKTKGKYNYLYFPDDGSNTKRHAGGQQFMARGAEASTRKIIDLCLGRLAEI